MAAAGIGGEYEAISPAVVEFVPKKVSGRTDAFIMSLWPVGAVCSALLVLLALRFFPAEIAWRAGFLYPQWAWPCSHSTSGDISRNLPAG